MEKQPKKLIDATPSEISYDRVVKQNMYAHIDDESPLGFSATKESNTSRTALDSVVSENLKLLQNPYAYAIEESDVGICALADNVQINLPAKQASYSEDELEQRASKIQSFIWKNRHKIWRASIPSDPVDMLDPTLALKLLGYESRYSDTLGEFFSKGKLIEVAGIVDHESRAVTLSQRYPIVIRNFTAAHELGHTALHEESGLHRDKPLDGSSPSRNRVEQEADKFATFFLMPENLVRTRFRKQFLSSNFLLNESTSFALGYVDYTVVKKELKTLRQLSRKLASTEYYNGKHKISLAQQFKVSIETMAIRLEELELIQS